MSELSMKTLIIAVSIALVGGLLSLGVQYLLTVPGILQGAVGAFCVGVMLIVAFKKHVAPQLGM